MSLGFNPSPLEQYKKFSTVDGYCKANIKKLTNKDDQQTLKLLSSLLSQLEKDNITDEQERSKYLIRFILEEHKKFFKDYIEGQLDLSDVKTKISEKLSDICKNVSLSKVQSYYQDIISDVIDKITSEDIKKQSKTKKSSNISTKKKTQKKSENKQKNKTSKTSKDLVIETFEKLSDTSLGDKVRKVKNIIVNDSEIKKIFGDIEKQCQIKTIVQKNVISNVLLFRKNLFKRNIFLNDNNKENIVKKKSLIFKSLSASLINKKSNKIAKKNGLTMKMKTKKSSDKSHGIKLATIFLKYLIRHKKSIFKNINNSINRKIRKNMIISKIYMRKIKKIIKGTTAKISESVSNVLHNKYTQKFTSVIKGIVSGVTGAVKGVCNGIKGIYGLSKKVFKVITSPLKWTFGLFRIIHKTVTKTPLGKVLLAFFMGPGAYFLGYGIGWVWVNWIKPNIDTFKDYFGKFLGFTDKYIINPITKFLDWMFGWDLQNKKLDEANKSDLDTHGFLGDTLCILKKIWSSIFGSIKTLDTKDMVYGIIDFITYGNHWIWDVTIGLFKRFGNIIQAASGWGYKVMNLLPGLWKLLGIGLLFGFKYMVGAFKGRDKDKLILNQNLSTYLATKPDVEKIDFKGDEQTKQQYLSTWETAKYENELVKNTKENLNKRKENIEQLQLLNYNQFTDLISEVFTSWVFPGEKQTIPIPSGFAQMNAEQQERVMLDVLNRRAIRSTEIIKVLNQTDNYDPKDLLKVITKENFDLNKTVNFKPAPMSANESGMGYGSPFQRSTEEVNAQQSKYALAKIDGGKRTTVQASNLLTKLTTSGQINVSMNQVREDTGTVGEYGGSEIIQLNRATELARKQLQKNILGDNKHSMVLLMGAKNSEEKFKLKRELSKAIQSLDAEKLAEIGSNQKKYNEFIANVIKESRYKAGIKGDLNSLEYIKNALIIAKNAVSVFQTSDTDQKNFRADIKYFNAHPDINPKTVHSQRCLRDRQREALQKMKRDRR